ncbi:hypothetical protein GZH53_00350, partial [Flavihumibacter sp. R14]|nr:hypothetical protein [Flavihumibacter soli]
ADGSFTYTPNANFNGTDSFTYKVSDGTLESNIATVTLTVTGSNTMATVSLTPSLSTIPEGNKTTITAELSAPMPTDIEVTLVFQGDAVDGADYNLFENFVTIVIPAGETKTTQHFIVAASVDDNAERDEHVLINIASVNSPSVRIGTGADVTIIDVLPPVKEVTEETSDNPILKPDPLISPNQDGQGNEQFKIINIEMFPDNEVMIFNRWGNEVYRIKGYDNDGKSFNGIANTGILTNVNKDLPEGVYYFVIYTIDADKKKKLNKGYLILKR